MAAHCRSKSLFQIDNVQEVHNQFLIGEFPPWSENYKAVNQLKQKLFKVWSLKMKIEILISKTV